MSVGGLIGAVVGGTIGFFIGGPAGAVYGASIGFSLGMYIDPITPDIPTPGAPLPAAAEIMTSTIGDPLPDLLGTAKITGHLLCFGKERTVTIMTQPEVEGGKGGPPEPDPYVSGYEYYMSWVLGIVTGPVDTLYTVYKGEDVVWEGELDIPVSGGEETITLEGMGSATFYFGTDDQVANSVVGELIGDSSLNSPYRHFCWCLFNDCCIGDYNRCPTMKFVLRKAPEIAFSGDNVIQTYDYNPIHAIWYILHDLAGLPETWLHYDDFVAAATTLTNDTRGICCFFESQQSTLNYLESINNHIDGIIRYGSDGKFHPKLIRDDYVIGNLPLIDEEVMLDDPTLNRKSWIDTVNELKVQYTEIPRTILVPFEQGEWVAAMWQPDTSNVYLYDIDQEAVIKLKVVSPPTVLDTLSLNPTGSLNYDMGRGTPGSQRGGYCMNKDGTRLWYMFRSGTDGQLIEIDITLNSMRIVKTTTFSGLLTTAMQDGCSNNDYTYWCDGLLSGRIIKIRNSDHSLIDDHYFNWPNPANYVQGICSVDTYNDFVYGNRVALTSNPLYNACSVHKKYDLDLNLSTEYAHCGLGIHTPQWQNMIKIHSGYQFQHRAYHPTKGSIYKRSLSTLTSLGSTEQEYLQNILGIYGGYLFNLWHLNATDVKSYLTCINTTTMVSVSSKNVSYYNGVGYLVYFDWRRTAVSALNAEDGIIILIRYNNVENKNYVTGFSADATMGLLFDESPLKEE